ncbi:siderophore-interacting protein [Devosia nitrariae]|uniref:Siderophore-interacting protein n=1 Tax=Devosia nitrariae TaxID=2071872 RepID=A0ABQ5W0C9_9HYPH|nr:siderophore-interacting protein [Devosia nitrariae]GLQ53370.1 siderophore-interacting protein [Devosia nitrariae]
MINIRPYRIFNVTFARFADVSPHLRRLTFVGPEIADMATFAPDQRIKIFFPRDGRVPDLPKRGDWYKVYKALPPADRHPMRTYTIRHLRAEQCEVDVDFVLHGETGPASRWATNAQPGDRVQISAPNRLAQGEIGGFEWKPPASARRILLAADETALPALAGILDELAGRAAPPRVEAFVEVPSGGDRIALAGWPGLELEWLARKNADLRPGDLMVAAVKRAHLPQGAGNPELVLEDIDIDANVPWELAEPAGDDFYAWIAGESEAVMAIRRFLIKDKGLDRRSLNLMGYWRFGKVYE